MIENIQCRLCGGSSKFSFSKEILSKYRVGYYLCEDCGSLQTEEPYWLDEAYNPINEKFDTGQLVRVFHNSVFLKALLTHLNLLDCRLVDYGCGSGLLTRFMRDIGIDAWGFDSYSMPRLSMGFHTDTLEGATVINLCEVAEHFERPLEYFDKIFSQKPDLLVMQTNLLEVVDAEWDYLAVDHGQHIFFYSTKGIEYLARRNNMLATYINGFIVFFNPNFFEKLFVQGSWVLTSDFQSALESSVPNFLNQMLANGYKYAIQDNLMLKTLNSGVSQK